MPLFCPAVLLIFTVAIIPVNSAKRVTLISVNDVYKLVGLPSELPYYYLREDFAYVDAIAAEHCDGAQCGPGPLTDCGRGDHWEACFPLNFDRTKEFTLKEQSGQGVRVGDGPCGRASMLSGEKYGGLVDFAATFKWLKEDAEAAGDLAVGMLAGDFIAPSFLAEIHRGKQLVEIMNHMGVDLVDIGNHDVDFKLPVLVDQMNKSAFHYLNANLVNAKGGEIQQPQLSVNTVTGNNDDHAASPWRLLDAKSGSRVGKGWAMLEENGMRVCVLGTTDIDKMNWPGKKVKGTERDIPAAVGILRLWEEEALGCSVKIAMTHTRTGNDLNLFRAVERAGFHLDAIIAGHDHYALFSELTRKDGGTTFFVKTGADARVISKLTFDLGSGTPVGSLQVIPVVAGSCETQQMSATRRSWLATTQGLFKTYVSEAADADLVPLNVDYLGVYDTQKVRDGESRAVNMWLDFMRQSVAGDLLFFQAGLVRQDMFQDFSSGVSLSQLFMLEEFPWGDQDGDARSSLFPFEVSLEDLVSITLPFLARKYWCRAPFNDANRIHMSGMIVEMISDLGCDTISNENNPIQSITFVGDCHRKGTLEAFESGCCKSSFCGRLWTDGAWASAITEEKRAEKLTVITGQFCVPSKYGSHGQGFHEAGMLCQGAESSENWGSGSDFAKKFRGQGVLDRRDSPLAASDWARFGYFFKPAIQSVLGSTGSPLTVGGDTVDQCKQSHQWYDATTFIETCSCEVRSPAATNCTSPGMHNPTPRFYAMPSSSFQHSGQAAKSEL